MLCYAMLCYASSPPTQWEVDGEEKKIYVIYIYIYMCMLRLYRIVRIHVQTEREDRKIQKVKKRYVCVGECVWVRISYVVPKGKKKKKKKELPVRLVLHVVFAVNRYLNSW